MNFRSGREKLCRNALDWIQTNLQEFDPTKNKANLRLRIKAFSELLLICYLHKRRFKTLPPPFNEFVSFGLDVLERMKYSDGIHRRPELILPYSMTYKSLDGCGARVETLRDDIQSMLDIGLPIASEDNPYRIMELRYALEDGGFKHLPPTIRSLYRNTSFHRSLNDTPPILSLRLDQVYGLTHLVFYLTGFGFSRRSIPELTSLRWLVSAQLGLQTLERNWDAVAELLMCCGFLRHFPSPFYRSAWFSLFRAQKTDGSLTDNLFDAKKYESMAIPEKRRYYFEQHYHTTLVAAAAALLAEEGNIERRDPFLHTTPKLQRLPDCTPEVKRAHAWLLKRYLDHPWDLEMSSLLYVLVGDWIYCSSLSLDGPCPEQARLYRRIRDNVVRSIRDSPGALEACDPALVFLGEGILRRFDLRVAQFELLAHTSVDALKADSQLDALEARLFPVRYLLDSLDLVLDRRGPLRTSKVAAATLIDYELGVTDENLLTLVNYVSSITLFGSLPFRAEESRLVDEILAQLTAFTYHHLLHYRLDQALMLVRAMNYAGMSTSKPFEEAIKYILAQQRNDGSFGYYSEEVELIGKSKPGFDSLQRLIIPTTVSAMWTVSEATVRGFSLFPSIRAGEVALKRRE